MYKNIFSLISGLVFGIGLTIGGMTNPAKVIAFPVIAHTGPNCPVAVDSFDASGMI